MENLSLSVPDLLTTVKRFVGPEKHPQLDQMLQRYMRKELGKQQVSGDRMCFGDVSVEDGDNLVCVLGGLMAQ